MSSDGYIRIVLDGHDCRTIADALRIFARELIEDYHRETRGKALPDEVKAQAERLEVITAKVAQFDGLNCCYEALISAMERETEHKAFDLASADWRTAAAALGFLADRLRAAEDKKGASLLADLAGKTGEIADWHEGLLAGISQMEQAALCEGEKPLARLPPATMRGFQAT